MDPKHVKRRILAQSDDDPTIQAVYKVGTDSALTYFLVVAKKHYEGREMLKLRYFALHDTDEAEDTWMQNGITARTSDELEYHLSQDLAALSGCTDTQPGAETKFRNLEPTIDGGDA